MSSSGRGRLVAGAVLGRALEHVGKGALKRFGSGLFGPERLPLLVIEQLAVLPLLIQTLYVGYREHRLHSALPIARLTPKIWLRLAHKQAFEQWLKQPE